MQLEQPQSSEAPSRLLTEGNESGSNMSIHTLKNLSEDVPSCGPS